MINLPSKEILDKNLLKFRSQNTNLVVQITKKPKKCPSFILKTTIFVTEIDKSLNI